MRVLYSFWGFITPLEKNSVVNTPDGERGNRVDWVNELLKRGHTPIQLQKMRDDEQYPGVEYDDSGFPDGDILYVEWRWPTWKNSVDNPEEPDYQRQCQVLDYYHEQGVPIVIVDGDLKMTPEEETIAAGSISAAGMFRKIAALTQSTDLDAYGLVSVSPATQAKTIEATMKECEKNETYKNIVLFVFNNVYNSFVC